MSLTISSFTDDVVLAFEPRLTPKEGRAMLERRRILSRSQRRSLYSAYTATVMNDVNTARPRRKRVVAALDSHPARNR